MMERYKDLIIYDGGFRNPYRLSFFYLIIIISNSDGFEIMNFAIRVPKSINNLLNYCDINKSSVKLSLCSSKKNYVNFFAKKMTINTEYKNKLKYKRQTLYCLVLEWNFV